MEILTQENTEIKGKILSLSKLIDIVEDITNNGQESLNGDSFMTDRELSERLKISRRTLQDYRDQGVISYYHVGEKILYKESDIEKLLNENHYEAFRM